MKNTFLFLIDFPLFEISLLFYHILKKTSRQTICYKTDRIPQHRNDLECSDFL